MRETTWVLVLVLGMAAAAGAAWAQDASDADRYFGLEWTGGERRGSPNVNGYIVNQSRVHAVGVRLSVESLDADGKTTATASGFVSDVPGGNRVYFEVRIKEKAARYRVTITGWAWRESGGQ
jgi:hypothetical protein